MHALGAAETIDDQSADLVNAVKRLPPEGIDALLDLVSDGGNLERIATTLKKGAGLRPPATRPARRGSRRGTEG